MRLIKVVAPVLAGLILSTTPVMGNTSVESKYQESCAACHDSGALKAPKTGDTAAWAALKSQKGMPALVDAVKNGGKQMPAGGLCSSCSDADYKALIEYMAK